MRTYLLRFLRALRGVETRFLIGVVLAVAGAWAFTALANSLGATPGPIDRAITRRLFGGEAGAYPFGSRALADMARDVTALGSAFILTLLVLTAVPYLFARHDRPGGFFLLAVVVGAALLSFILKALIARERPDFASAYVFETSASFPSGHSLLSAALYPALAVIIARRELRSSVRLLFQINALLVVVLVGTSRVLLGAHYTTDVLAGWAAGFAWVALCSIGLSYTENRKNRQKEKKKEGGD